MKKLYFLALIAAMAVPAQAFSPFQKGLTRPAGVHRVAAHAPETQTLVDEDFSRFTDGTAEAPAPDMTSDGNYRIPVEYTAQPGWTGRGVHPAGGCVVLQRWDIDEDYSRGGYMSTPPMLLNGTATLTFRAKKFGTEDASIWVSLCSEYGPGDDQDDFSLTDEWQTFTLVATHGGLDVDSYFQIMADEGSAYLDDVKLTFRMDRIAAPDYMPAVNLSPTSFRAMWGEVANAEGYLLTVKCTETPAEVVKGEIVESFEGINLTDDGKKIDAANPSYPEGWTIDVSTNGSQDATADPSEVGSGAKALMFDAVGDFIETADAPLPLDALSFWAKAVGPEETDYGYMSLIKVELYHASTGVWDHVANLYYADFEYSDGVYTLNPMTFTDDVTRVRLTMLQEGTKKFFIDDIRMGYHTRGTVSNIIDDLRVEGTSYDVTDINPVNEYEYYVKAYNDDIVSEASYPAWVDGVAGLKVIANEAADVTTTSFTASWQPLGHATDYTVSLKKVLTATADLSDVVVLEENFDNITEGTVDNPGTDWMSPFDFGAKGWASTPWGATQPAWAAGMAGTTGTNAWLGTAGLVFTPTLDLSFYDGKGITVEGTFVTTVADLSMYGSDEKEGIYAMLMSSYNDQQAMASGYLETPSVGSHTGKMVIANVPDDADLSNVIIAFMDKSGMPFFVDDVKISMNVPAGKSLITPFDVKSTQNTSYKFENLDPTCDYAYQVSGSVTRNFIPYTSDQSDAVIVRTSQAGIDEIEAEAATAQYFNLQGMKVAADALVPGIYIERRGSAARKVLVR